VVSDEQVNQLAGKEREAANRVPTGSALKLRRRAQLTRALRRAHNRPGGYWVAAANPQAASSRRRLCRRRAGKPSPAALGVDGYPLAVKAEAGGACSSVDTRT